MGLLLHETHLLAHIMTYNTARYIMLFQRADMSTNSDAATFFALMEQGLIWTLVRAKIELVKLGLEAIWEWVGKWGTFWDVDRMVAEAFLPTVEAGRLRFRVAVSVIRGPGRLHPGFRDELFLDAGSVEQYAYSSWLPSTGPDMLGHWIETLGREELRRLLE